MENLRNHSPEASDASPTRPRPARLRWASQALCSAPSVQWGRFSHQGRKPAPVCWTTSGTEEAQRHGQAALLVVRL